MYNDYKYIDAGFTYIDPKTGILINIPEIRDPEVLHFVESVAVTKRLQELYENPIKISGINSLFEIHKYIFQDMYFWAGKKRIVEISKEGKQFFPLAHFDSAFNYIDNLIIDYQCANVNNKLELALKLAEILDHVNYLHPFREGNGRAQREFLRLLALEKELILNLNPPDNKSVYLRYMKGTIESDLKILNELILELIQK